MLNRLIATLALLGYLAFGAPVLSQNLQALARLETSLSRVSSRASGDIDITLKLTQAVPYRVFILTEPNRLVMDFREVDFSGVKAKKLIATKMVTDMRVGIFQPGWSRMVLELLKPMQVFQASMKTDATNGDALIRIRLTPGNDSGAVKKGTAAGNQSAIWSVPSQPSDFKPKTRPNGDRKFVIALDPGHGGIDPGAHYQSYFEADLMLKLARELKEALILSGRFEAFLTRKEDKFMSLQSRITTARNNGADVFISLHADALSEGTATGTTVYTLSDKASDNAAQELVASHNRADLLAGVDLSTQDDVVASVLMDMARLETMPRSEKLADAVVKGIAEAIGKIRARPRLSAGFSVLKAPDMPSILIEFGFMSNPKDLSNLANPNWRQKAIRGLVNALDLWSFEDSAQARLLRQ